MNTERSIVHVTPDANRFEGTVSYYAREGARRIRHYLSKRLRGYTYRGSLEEAAESIIRERARTQFASGSHFHGVWPRDLCFAALGICQLGFGEELVQTGNWLMDQLDETFYTDFHPTYNVATPAEGVDTFPAMVILLDECDRATDPGAERSFTETQPVDQSSSNEKPLDYSSRDMQRWNRSVSDVQLSASTTSQPATDRERSEFLSNHASKLALLAQLHYERFFDPDTGIVSGSGSAWWDSSAKPREAYNTALLCAAVDRLEDASIETVYTGMSTQLREALFSTLWNGNYLRPYRGSDTLACDANVVPLYLGILDDDRARSIVSALSALETAAGLTLRHRPFSIQSVHPFFTFHRGYHAQIWPWNSFMFAIGANRYGCETQAERERKRVERVLSKYGTFLEVYTTEGKPYSNRGYASAEDFLVAAALWVEYTALTEPSTQYNRIQYR